MQANGLKLSRFLKHTVRRTDALIKFLSIYSIELIMLDEIVFVCRAADES